ncbi:MULTISPECIES: F0F1 ATP synthase subunit delta [unclassified Agromyces]|uniref:F0F1 ATP synthase subunit delta n=1 Tax=unclassified Agromyces TaxID=2639701 RepID=UPI0030142087
MGSATRGALAGTRAQLADVGRAELPVASDLLAASRVIGATPHLRTALTDNEAGVAEKRALIERVFGGKVSPTAVTLLVNASSQRWSSGADFLSGLEELGLRVAADAAGDTDVDAELYSFQRLVARDAQLELALGSKLGSTDAKVALVDRLLGPAASPATTLIVRHLVQSPRGRRIGEMLRNVAGVVADQRGFDVATVTSAVPLTDDQLARLERTLGAQAGRRIRFDSVVDPTVVGGVRVQVGDDVIDGSVASRLNDLRQKLAG